MQKFIPGNKLAREDRFVLIRGRKERQIRDEQGLDDGKAVTFDEEALRARLHGLFAGEVQAMEAAGRTLFDFPDAPWEFQLDMARQIWDESRHTEIFMRLLEHVGCKPGEYVESDAVWRCTQTVDPACRVAGINRGLEGFACDIFDQLIRYAQRIGDEVIERAMDYVLADEITHVRMGSKWMRKLTEGDADRRAFAQAFQDAIDERLNFRGFRHGGEPKPGEEENRLAIAREARLLAGFTEEEIERLADSARKSAQGQS